MLLKLTLNSWSQMITLSSLLSMGLQVSHTMPGLNRSFTYLHNSK
jgi:hypothetical protein